MYSKAMDSIHLFKFLTLSALVGGHADVAARAPSKVPLRAIAFLPKIVAVHLYSPHTLFPASFVLPFTSKVAPRTSTSVSERYRGTNHPRLFIADEIRCNSVPNIFAHSVRIKAGKEGAHRGQ
jgi:hypothetical protein